MDIINVAGTEEDELVAMESLDIDVLFKLTAGEDKMDFKLVRII